METSITTVVTGVETVTPGFIRVRVTTPPSAWTTTGRGDEFVHVEVGAETIDTDGHSARHYTVSRVLSDGFEMEIAIHGDGPGANWAQTVRPGETVAVSEPKAYYRPPAATHRRVLLGDATALPAIARILAEASEDERFTVLIELASMDDARALPSRADVEIEWRLGGNGVVPSIMEHEAREIVPALLAAGEEPYVWVACESKESRRVRQYLRGEAGVPLKLLRIVGYWHFEAAKAIAAWEALTDEQKDQYMAIWRDDRSDEENWIELEPFLRRMGV